MQSDLKPNYIVRNRGFVWGRQLSYLSIVLLLLWKLTQISTLTLDPIYMGALLFSIVYNNEPDDPHHMKWLILDLSQLLYGSMLLFKMTAMGLMFNIIIFALSVLGCYCALANAIFKPAYYVHHTPTEEYTCKVFDYLSFAYITKTLITAGCKVASFELDFLPTLMDPDSATFVWLKFRRIYSHLGGDAEFSADDENVDTGSTGLKQKSLGDLVHSIYILFWKEIWLSFVLSIISTLCQYVTPLAMQRIMFYLSNYDRSGGDEQSTREGESSSGLLLGDLGIYSTVGLLFLCPLVSGMFATKLLVYSC